MNNTATLALLAVVFLLAGCSSKQIFFFPPAAGSYLAPPEQPQSEHFTAAAALPASPTVVPEQTAAADPEAFAAATAPAAGPVQNIALRPLTNAALQEHLLVKAEQPPVEPASAYQTPPKGKKKAMVGSIEAGFALSLFGVVSIALVFITPYLLFFSGALTFTGLVLSIIGLLKIRKNKAKLRGKVRAWAGIILGLLGTALVLILLNNNF
ncbi:DUF4190 domain-containing protein [Botryobacter ruber]|uniref:DUF4190 domain-containing protein n=1 Tax=Botryobacter ruber TaxID=2171629 RepID=UPI000FEC407B|nr:DUF4190 domain-containing protein [Botryobacter ruber]